MRDTTIEQCGGSPGGECFLLRTEKSAVLLDSGFSFSASAAADNIERALGGKRLDYILLSHSHYDHAGGSGLLRTRFPGVKVVAHPHAATIFAKESAKKLMRALNAGAALLADMPPEAASIGLLRADTLLEDHDRVKTADLSIRAVETPGHTRCSLSYYFEELDLIYASETSGVVPNYPEVSPAFMSSYRETLASIARQERIGAKHVFVPHFGVIPGEDARSFFPRCREAAEEHAAFVLDAHKQGLEYGEIVELYRRAYYTDSIARIQPEEAFLVNAHAMIPRLVQEMEAVGRI